MASDFEFRHAKVLGWILLYAKYLDTKLGSIKTKSYTKFIYLVFI